VQQVNESPPQPAELETWLADRSPRRDRYQSGRDAHRNAPQQQSFDTATEKQTEQPEKPTD
jgi:hypothetical protein